MEHPYLTARNLYCRYRRGELDFSGVDLNGESLRGMNLRGINLGEADLSHTDLRGTNFTDAKLLDADLSEAKTGTLRRWAVLKVLIAAVFLGVASLVTAAFCGTFAVLICAPNGSNTVTKTVGGDIVIGFFQGCLRRVMGNVSPRYILLL